MLSRLKPQPMAAQSRQQRRAGRALAWGAALFAGLQAGLSLAMHTALPRWRDGKLYWLVEGAFLLTADRGETWTKLSDVKDGRVGPVFGKDAKQLFVLTAALMADTLLRQSNAETL